LVPSPGLGGIIEGFFIGVFVDWYPWHFDLYAAATMHLDHYQDCCYRRLIDHYMKTRQPLPNDDRALARIIGDSHDRWMILAAPVVRPFFEVRGKFLHKKLCDDILNFQDKKTKRLSQSGKKGAEIRKQNQKNKVNEINDISRVAEASAIAQDNTGEVKEEELKNQHTERMDSLEGPSAQKTEKPKIKKKEKLIGKRLEQWLEENGFRGLPPDWGNYALGQGASREFIAQQAKLFNRYWNSPDAKGGGTKKDWFGTWQNWIDRAIDSPVGKRPAVGKTKLERAAESAAEGLALYRAGRAGAGNGPAVNPPMLRDDGIVRKGAGQSEGYRGDLSDYSGALPDIEGEGGFFDAYQDEEKSSDT